MLRVEFVGGLGNQLFTLAGGLWLSREIGSEVILDLSRARIESQGSVLQFDNVSSSRGAARSLLVRKARLGSRIDKLPVFREAAQLWEKSGRRRRGYLDLDSIRPFAGGGFRGVKGAYGYAQTRLFLEALSETGGFQELEVKRKSRWWEENFDRVTHPTAVVVHVRRGDFTSRLNRLLSVDYYKAALRTMESRLERGIGEVVVFSDDMTAARDVLWDLRSSWKMHFIEPHPGGSSSVAEQLVLMSRARQFIASNSTFSWWAAANLRTGKLVCVPDQWTAGVSCGDDLYFPEWIQVPAEWLF